MLITSLRLGPSKDIAFQKRKKKQTVEKLCQASRTTGEIAKENI